MLDPAQILITGGQGRLGRALARLGCTALGRGAFDLLDTASMDAALARVRPLVVINAAAYTAVDRAETERDAALALNGEAVRGLAEICAARGVPLLQVSTDCVFGDRSPRRPVREDETPDPLSVYGESKRLGERYALRPGNVIVRVSWLFDQSAESFIGKILNAARGRETLSLVQDEWGRPTSVEALAAQLVQLAGLMVGAEAETLPQVLHLGPSEPVNRYDWAVDIFAQSARLGGPSPRLEPVSADAFKTPARRPRGLVLDTSQADALLGPMPNWRTASRAAVAAILGAA